MGGRAILLKLIGPKNGIHKISYGSMYQQDFSMINSENIQSMKYIKYVHSSDELIASPNVCNTASYMSLPTYHVFKNNEWYVIQINHIYF